MQCFRSGIHLSIWQVNTSFDKSEIREVISIYLHIGFIWVSAKITPIRSVLIIRLSCNPKFSIVWINLGFDSCKGHPQGYSHVKLKEFSE